MEHEGNGRKRRGIERGGEGKGGEGKEYEKKWRRCKKRWIRMEDDEN
jgi:hypothetical protein